MLFVYINARDLWEGQIAVMSFQKDGMASNKRKVGMFHSCKQKKKKKMENCSFQENLVKQTPIAGGNYYMTPILTSSQPPTRHSHQHYLTWWLRQIEIQSTMTSTFIPPFISEVKKTKKTKQNHNYWLFMKLLSRKMAETFLGFHLLIK